MSSFFGTSLATRLTMAGSKLKPTTVRRQLIFFAFIIATAISVYFYLQSAGVATGEPGFETIPETSSLLTTFAYTWIGSAIGAIFLLSNAIEFASETLCARYLGQSVCEKL